MKTKLISIAIPYYPKMKNAKYYIDRCLASIREQSYQNYEIVITNKGSMPENTNAAIRQSKGELIKILYMDDFFAHKDALKNIVENFKGEWLVTGCKNDKDLGRHYPTYSDDIERGNNTIGSPSVLTIKNGLNIYFDEELSWLLDCDFYKRLYEKHGEPVILNDINVVIGIHDGQATNTLGNERKLKEHKYMQKKYDTSS